MADEQKMPDEIEQHQKPKKKFKDLFKRKEKPSTDKRIDEYLVEKLGLVGNAAQAIEKRLILVNGKPVLPSYVLNLNDKIKIKVTDEQVDEQDLLNEKEQSQNTENESEIIEQTENTENESEIIEQTENTENNSKKRKSKKSTDKRIDEYLAEKFGSVETTAEAINNRLVMVNGEPVSTSYVLKVGDTLKYKVVAEYSYDAFLEVNDLKQYFPVATNFFGKPIKFLKAVDGVSFKLQKGKTLGIVGESGCGKTTMGRTILRLYETTGGDVWFKGQKVSALKNREFDKLRPNMQMIFQDPYASLSPRLTIGEIIGEAAKQHKIVSKKDYHDYILSVMEMCGLQPHYFERYPHEFSGGQRQRICIARALALKPELVICDEPVSALDVSIQAQIINMLIELRKTLGLTYVFISHDLSVVKHISDEIGVMYLGSMVEYGSKDAIFNNTLHPYTKALFSAVPVPDPHVKMNRIILKGDIPSPVNPPKGCKFHTRCENCMEICSRIAPAYKEVEEGHFCACHLYNTPEELKQYEILADVADEMAEREEASKPFYKDLPEKIKAKIKEIFKRKKKEEEPVEVKEEVPAKSRRTINDITAEVVDEAFNELYAPAPAKPVEEEKPVKKVAAKKTAKTTAKKPAASKAVKTTAKEPAAKKTDSKSSKASAKQTGNP
ncbi:MAG: ATP-binding cassette domain-containing protein, partial [Clostridia bacterium]|nr:ATP-binding cassette domain-containing protein [Clostridia bacterium]